MVDWWSLWGAVIFLFVGICVIWGYYILGWLYWWVSIGRKETKAKKKKHSGYSF